MEIEGIVTQVAASSRTHQVRMRDCKYRIIFHQSLLRATRSNRVENTEPKNRAMMANTEGGRLLPVNIRGNENNTKNYRNMTMVLIHKIEIT